ncbi:MAG: L-arabinose isomerase [Micrococcales bacterium]|nr:L-arabinose isomerase [Micrococcales bacterium]
MKTDLANREVWFLTGSQEMYGEETLRQVAVNSKALVKQLDAAGLPVKVVWQPALTSKAAIEQTVLAANAQPSCVGLIAWMHTFSPAKMWIAGLIAARLPLLHLHTQVNEALPWSTIDMDFMNLNQSAHGDREFAYIESRLGITRKTVAGSLANPAVISRIDSWARAALAHQDAKQGAVLRFGDNMRDVAVTDGDKIEAEATFGFANRTYAVTELAQAIEATHLDQVTELVEQYLDLYQVAAELRPGGARAESLFYAARQELALKAFLDDHGATAFTTNFEDLGALRQLPGLAVQRLMAQGYGFGAEGDWKTAMLVRIAKVMGAGLPGGASMMEDYTYHLVPGEEKSLGAHMLEVCPSLTTAKPKVEIHPLSIGAREDPVRLVFTADSGPATVVGLADMGARLRLTALTVNLVPPDQPLPKLPVACAVWLAEPDWATAAECWLAAGAPHHTCLSSAVPVEAWEDFATITGTEFALITKGTTVRQFTRELSWNAAAMR